MTKIECQFLTDQGTCKHVDASVGLPILITPSACAYCIESHPDPETRKDSYPVRCWTYKERAARGLPVGEVPTNPRAVVVKQPTSQQLPPVHTAERPPAPVVADPEARYEICTDCPADKWKQERCTACTSCKNRPRPKAEQGADCPLGFWRRG